MLITRTDSQKITARELILVTLSVYVICAAFVSTVWKLAPELARLLNWFDNSICMVFLADFFWRFRAAKNKLAFLRWGWIDLLSSIPNLDMFRWGRLISMIRIIRILRSIRSIKVITKVLFRHRINSSIGSVIAMSALFIMFSAITILNVETDPQANIRTAGDALWWAVSTITTVGYGDKFPVTTSGRVVAAILMVCGVTLFAIFTATFASIFAGPKPMENTSVEELANEIRLLRREIAELKQAQVMTSVDE
ncbi:MAG: Ion transport 2 domain protein [Verrucomicrobiales bacterium]|nr:Ion transport 2 domain protein [Verrucomicrobiales bacterium]MDB6130579.1 Ion transport 2 domain protein [Verrucomicrobiales bacterium]